mgnify:FL=1
MNYKKFHLRRLKNELLNSNSSSDSSSSDYKYLDVVRSAINNPEVYEKFRSNPGYKDILEHVDESLAQKYYENINKKLTHDKILHYCTAIKNIGNPELISINGDLFNPTTLRYINVALDIKQKFPTSNFNNIIEIGAGYGGQSLILDKFFKIKKYNFIDLPEVNLLIEKFINSHNVNFKSEFATLDSLQNNNSFDLVISNYAFSELPKKIQLVAISKIIQKSQRGYMIVNNFHKISFRYMTQAGYIRNIKNLEIDEEIPNSYLFNKLLTF